MLNMIYIVLFFVDDNNNNNYYYYYCYYCYCCCFGRIRAFDFGPIYNIYDANFHLNYMHLEINMNGKEKKGKRQMINNKMGVREEDIQLNSRKEVSSETVKGKTWKGGKPLIKNTNGESCFLI